MADDDNVSVRFTADVSELTTAIGLAKAQLASFSEEVNRYARQGAGSAAAASSALNDAMEAATGGASGLKSAVGGADAALASVEKSATNAASAFGSAGLTATYLTRETRALLDEASSGRWRQFDGTVVNLATHAAQLAANFAASNPLVAAAGAAAAVAGGWVAYLSIETLRAAQVAQQFKESLNLSGAITLAEADISDLSETIRNLAGVSRDQAKEIVASFGAMANGSKAVFETIASDLGTLATARDVKPEQMAKELEDLFSRPYDSAERLVKIVGDLADAERGLLDSADATGNPLKAQAAIAQILQDHLSGLRAAREKDIEASLRQAEASRDAMATMGGEEATAALAMLNSQIAAWQKELAAIKSANDEARKQAGILDSSQATAEQLRERFDDVLKSISPWTSELQKAQDAIAALRAGLQASTGDAAALIRQFEGFKDRAYLDSDGKYRVGFGSDTTTSASGAVSSVTAETTTTRADAERDLARRVVEFQTEAAREIGAAWARLTDEAKASITSVTYNYGHVPDSVAAAARTGGNAEIAGAIGSLSSNPGRRAQEAANITGGGSAVTDPEKVRQGTGAIAEQQDRINALNAAKSGGTEIEKANLANLQAEVAGRKDDVAAAERLVEATKRQLADAHSLTEQRKLQADLASAEGTLHDRQNAAQEAQLRLGIGQAQGRGDAAGQRDAAVALATFKMSLYGRDTAAYREALGEKEAADRQYANTQKQVAMDGAQADLESIQSATAAKIRGYDEDFRAHLISESRKVADVEAALAQEISKERDILNQELALDNLRPPERKKILDELLLLEQGYAQQVKQIQTESAADAAKSWQGLASTIEGAVNSQLKSVITGGESVRTALSKAAEDIAFKWIEKGEQIVANWIADQMAMKTATNLGDIGSSLAGFVADAMKAIAAGAGETAAGVSGFLAPILGPAAVPAGLAAGAAISAGARGIGAMDIGAYNVPTDQLAMIHKNELVMPAPEATQFRANLSAQAAGGGGAGGGDVHHHWNVSAIDSQSFVAALRHHSSPLSKIVGDAMTRNPSTRGRY
jgi:GH24 family phage-related lysozyme (muramidase)